MKKLLIPVFFLIFSSLTFAEKKVANGYGGVELGMSLDQVKKALKANTDFGYHGERDVSLLPGENRILIETDASTYAGFSFLERCWFQFYNDKLYIITTKHQINHIQY